MPLGIRYAGVPAYRRAAETGYAEVVAATGSRVKVNRMKARISQLSRTVARSTHDGSFVVVNSHDRCPDPMEETETDLRE